MKSTKIRLEDATYKALQDMAARKQRSLNKQISYLLEEFVATDKALQETIKEGKHDL